ncbi:methyltransferase domain-containing protein [Brucella anthropi]|uniref:class I SAM-dependent methyltransferase n=1 Tax=Brucella anthropi TaxID=529 RepID=UPI002672D54B|nr:methyltransferase domain-containing protein [Brucella anthropi]WKT93368.1 methyltransferase domain-containing protein [Brucella anthropi]
MNDPGSINSECIQYACGHNPIDGWINVDLFDGSFLASANYNIEDKLKHVINIDLLDVHPFDDETFTYAYCEDFVEHLDQREAILFFVEVFRTLRPGGVLRLSTPSLNGVLKHHFCGVDREQAYHQADEAFVKWGHRHFFTHQTMKLMAESIGFSDYMVCSFGVSNYSALRERETRSGQKHINLYAEMKKPS